MSRQRFIPYAFALAAALAACEKKAGRAEPMIADVGWSASDPKLELDAGATGSPAAPAPTDAAAPFDARADAGDAGPADGGISTSTSSWRVRVLVDMPVLEPNDQGCLTSTASHLHAGDEIEIYASDGRYDLVDEHGRCVLASRVATIQRPEHLARAPQGTIFLPSFSYAYGAGGCPVQTSTYANVPYATPVDALARSYDANYHGMVVVGRDLRLAPVRVVDAPGWVYPWHASVQLVKQVPQGFVIGGGIVVGPTAIVTAGHMGADDTYCYSRQPNSGIAWMNHQFVCNNIVGPAQKSPDDVDVAIIHLINPEPPPYGKVRVSQLQAGEAFYTSNWSSFFSHRFTDSTVLSVGNGNAWCHAWPDGSSFVAHDLVVGPGDSGGPAWVGDEVVGVVHGQLCGFAWEPERHVFIDLPGVRAFLAPVLP